MRKTSTEREGEGDQDDNGVRRFWRESEGKEAAKISFNPQNCPLANCPPISLNCRSISKTIRNR